MDKSHDSLTEGVSKAIDTLTSLLESKDEDTKLTAASQILRYANDDRDRRRLEGESPSPSE